MKTTYRTMDRSDLGGGATVQDLADFRAICEEAQRLHPEMSDEEVTDAVWGDGDYLANARRLGVGVDAIVTNGEPPDDAGNELTTYAEAEIVRLGLGDGKTNCHGVAAYYVEGGVRLSDGVGLNVVCRTRDDVDTELEEMTTFYAQE